MATQQQEPVQAEGYQKIEEFVKKYKNLLVGGIGAIAIIIAGFVLYKKLIVAPRAVEAQEKIYEAQKHFAKDSLNLALYGDGINPGFLEVVDNFGKTPTGNLARYYAGVCFIKLGDFNKALEHLKKFSTSDEILGAKAYENIGHAYAELQNMEDALKYYMKAAETGDTDLNAYYYKLAGDLSRNLGDYEKAKTCYEAIKERFPLSDAARFIDRDLGFVNAKL